jgi:phage-related protein
MLMNMMWYECRKSNNIQRLPLLKEKVIVLYFDGKIVLTNSFIKKTQKTSREETRLAKERRADYKERMGKL